MKILIITDIEGVVGVDSFSQVRTNDNDIKGPAMRQLAREVNAAVRGIHSIYPEATVYVWDGHGSGGLLREDIEGGIYLREGRPYYHIKDYSAVLFVGQHAMAGTAFAPLCHTYSSLHIASYKLNGFFIGEFGARAVVAGSQGVPTVYLSGDDKAALEAKIFIPDIHTTVVKHGLGLEEAKHLNANDVYKKIQGDVAASMKRLDKIPPLKKINPPYTLEIRYYEPQDKGKHSGENVTWIDDRTVEIKTTDLERLPF
jgi:D-amino peptidase